ncbi:MAG: hypothetical protein ACLP9L_25210 [Thermoguttaceae bacterium]
MVHQLPEETLAVVITVEDVRPTVAAAGDMIDGVGKIDARRAEGCLQITIALASPQHP